MTAPIIAFDLGGSRLRVGLVDSHGDVLGRVIEESRSEEGPARVADRIVETARELLKRGGYGQPLGVGAAVAGPMDAQGVIYDPPNLIGWKTVRFKAMLEERFGGPVWMGNDANLACLGERLFGAARGVNDVIYLTLSTGVGGGVITGGALVTGWRGLGAEVGHIIIDPDGPRGKCGHMGCLESLVSGTAIAQRAREALRRGETSALSGIGGGQIERVMAEHVFQAAAGGDPVSMSLVQRVAESLGVGIVSLVHVFNPRMLVLGGGVSRSWHMLAPGVHRVLRDRAFPGFLEGFDVTVSAFGDDVGLVGAAALVLRETAFKK